MANCRQNRRGPHLGAIEGIEVGARFTTRFDMKMKGLHVSNRSIWHVIDGVASLIVQTIHTDHGDTITIPITQQFRRVGHIPKVVRSFYASLKSKAPIRVIRQPTGGQYAPLINYRYDGLYTVEKINNVFNIDILEMRYVVCIVRLPSQTQVYEMLPTTNVSPSEIIEIEDETTDEAVEILEHSHQRLSDVD